MEKYKKYKDSGIEWIGEIPEHWEKYRLGIIGQFSSSGIDKKLVDNEPKVKIINYTDIYGNGNSILDSSKDYMIVTTPQSKIDEHSVKKGDLIFTPSSETKEDIGLSALVIEDLENTAFSYHVLRFQFTRIVDLNFKKYICNNYYVLNHFSRNSQGTTRQTLGRNDFKTAEIILPTPEEQTAIANYLDRKTTEIDELIADKKRLLELYEEEKTAIINQAVTKGINPNVPKKDSGIEWLGEIPEHWEVKRLKYVISKKLMYGANENADEENRDNPRYIRITDFGNDGKLKNETFKSLAPEKANDYLLTNGDILFARSGATVGKTFQFKNYEGLACFAGYLIKATPNPKIMESDFLYYFTKSGLYENWKGSIFNQATIQNIGADKYAFLEIPTPPTIKEQQSIVHHIETECALIDAKTEKTKKLIDLLTEYRTALISEVVTGKIKVTE